MGFLPTAYVVRREGYVLTHVCLSVNTWGYPSQGVPHRGYPHWTWPGVSQWRVPTWPEGYLTEGTPPRVPPHRTGLGGTSTGGYPISGSTWYAAVSMPLAFTQEDFLVLKNIISFIEMKWLNWINDCFENCLWTVSYLLVFILHVKNIFRWNNTKTELKTFPWRLWFSDPFHPCYREPATQPSRILPSGHTHSSFS